MNRILQKLRVVTCFGFVCRSGGRSSQAVRFLESNGFQVINMTGGMLAWE